MAIQASNSKQVKRVRLGHASKVILSVVAVGGVVTIAAAVPGLTATLQPFMKRKKYSSKQYIDRSLQSLIKAGLVEYTTDDDGNQAIRLTKKGKWESAIRRLEIPQFGRKPKWDGSWHVIVFDVPEQKRALRHELRRAVELYGFAQLQKSVWVYPHPCDDFVSLLKSHLGISHDVLYLKVSFLENDKWLRREFSL